MRVPVRVAGAALVAAGVAASGVLAGGAPPAAASATGAPATGAPAAATPAAGTPARTPATAPRSLRPAYTRVVTVRRLSNSGPGSLRAAINAANRARTGRATLIRFAVRGTITLSRPLPALSRPVTINGASAPGYASAAPVVEINANGQSGLDFAAGSAGSRLLALAVDDAGGDGVILEASNITLDGNYIGLSLLGSGFGNHGDGVFVAATSQGNTIGENPARKSGAVSNVISGNDGNGITLSGSSVNTVQDNRIGTSRSGTVAIPNRDNGLAITGRSYGNEIGGTAYVDSGTGAVNNPTGSKGTVTPVFVVPPLGNQISC